jgi:pyruvate carboxylase
MARDLDGDVLTFSETDGGCSFDVSRAFIKYKPWERVA